MLNKLASRTIRLRNLRLTAFGGSHAITCALLCLASTAVAQRTGSIASDRARLGEITGDTSRAAALRPAWMRVVPPDVRIVWNSAIPYSLNDGAMWAGRGMSSSVSAGVESSALVRGFLLRVRVAPTFLFSENKPFPITPSTTAGRSAFASPFHGPASSMDLPLRFGDLPLRRFDPGRSEVFASWRGVALRLTADNDWWGPAIRNALVMSDNAAGIPRLELASTQPTRTPIGAVTWKVIAGSLTESMFFDTAAFSSRIINGATITLRPKFDSTLTFGISRVVYRPNRWRFDKLHHLLDFVWDWQRIPRISDAGSSRIQWSDQLTAINARWVFPSYGFEVYGEWAQADLPRSPAEVLAAPFYGGAYTFGFQWAQPRRAHSFLRLQTEISYLEQSQVLGDRLFTEYYSGKASRAGYTQRGQVIGAAIGPGASSQWFAVDHIAPRWQAGLFAGRVRWENDALYREMFPNFFKHDFTVLGGVRGALRTPFTDFSADATLGHRYHYLFQSGFANPGFYRTVDMHNLTVSFSATPR